MELLLSMVLIGVGAYNWILLNEIHELREQIEDFSMMIHDMAQELHDLGSPNVKVFNEKQ